MKTVISYIATFCCITTASIAFAQTKGDLTRITIANPFVTIDTTLLFESYISSYTFADQIVEERGFILHEPICLKTYKSFYCVFQLSSTQQKSLGPAQVQWIHNNVKVDEQSVRQLNIALETYSFPKLSSSLNLTPFCGTRYFPCKIKVDLYYVGELSHRVPLFLNCPSYDSYKKRHINKNYKIEKLHTFLITKVY